MHTHTCLGNSVLLVLIVIELAHALAIIQNPDDLPSKPVRLKPFNKLEPDLSHLYACLLLIKKKLYPGQILNAPIFVLDSNEFSIRSIGN